MSQVIKLCFGKLWCDYKDNFHGRKQEGISLKMSMKFTFINMFDVGKKKSWMNAK